MKTIQFVLAITILISAYPLSVYAQEGIIVKQKTIKNHYKVRGGDTLVVFNGYGDIFIHTWDKKIMTVEITEMGRDKNPKKAQTILDNIYVEQKTASSGSIYFTTNIKTPYNIAPNGNTYVQAITTPPYNNYQAKVIYVFNVPKNMNLNIRNSVGDVDIDDFSGGMDIDIFHGCFHAKNLSKANKKIRIDGSSHADPNDSNIIASIEQGEFTGGRERLTIIKPIDTSKVIFKSTWEIIVAGKRYK